MTYEHLEAVIRLVIAIGIAMPVAIIIGLVEMKYSQDPNVY